MPGDAPDIPTAQEEAQAQIALERERAKLAQDQANSDRALAEADKAKKVAQATGKQASNYDAALEYGDQQSQGRGYDQSLVDQYGVGDLYRSQLDATRRGFGEDDTSAMYGERTAYDDAVQQGVGRYRNDLEKQFDGFAGGDYSTNAFADTADDDILNSILGTQYNDVLSKLDASKARGTLNEGGYGKALAKLEEQKKAGGSQIQSLGQGVLSGYRGQLDNLRNNERTKLGGADFRNPFDVNSVQGKLESLRSSLGGKLEGDLFNATSGQSFFDPTAILQYGSSSQGAFNPSKQASVGGDNPLLSAFTETNKKPGGGLLASSGSNGAF